MDPLTDQLPPQNLDAEASALGAMLLFNEVIPAAKQIIKRDYFYKPTNRIIFDVITYLHEEKEPADIVTVRNELTNMGSLEEVGGVMYLSELLESVPSAQNIESYCKIIREMWTRRKIIEVSMKAANRAYDGSDRVQKIASEVNAELCMVGDTFVTDKSARASDIARRWVKEVELGRIGKPIYVGEPVLDDLTEGFYPGDVVMIGAYSTTGKTVLAMNMAVKLAEGKHFVDYFSTETTEARLLNRYLRMRSGARDIRLHRLPKNPDERQRVMRTIEDPSLERLFWHFGTWDVADIRTKIDAAKLRRGCTAVFIDFFDQLKMGKGESQTSKESKTMNELARVARDTGVVMVILSQFHKPPQQQKGKRPDRWSFKGAGEKYDASDFVFVLYAEKNKLKDDRGQWIRARALDMVKRKDGPQGKAYVEINPNTLNLENWDDVRGYDW